ncbi:peptidylprolyl isomerase [Paenibacillus camelliae]|uniref:peptidylprolyl isomerase n=1 Tax=Paenibacillus camelliae TaxID=512410 RepID=UPI0020411FBC|nr:peptidylprolyl isomerase [Paenibacillus camelliae]MCM3633758.1 peptidylprolyl isomerase [Paenibacillus camelliae]
MDNKETQSQQFSENNEVAGNAPIVNNNERNGGGSKNNPFWMIASIILAIALILVIIFPIGGNKEETLATVNGTKITQKDLLGTLQQYYGDSITSVLDRMITEEVVGQEAKAKNIKLTDADLSADIAALKIDYGSEENFQSFLSYYGMTEDDLKNELKLQTLVRLLLQDTVEVTDEEVQTYFDENKSNLGGSAEKVKASHILVTDKALAEDILAQLKDGADFAELAAQYGTDGTATTGGDLGFFTYEEMVPQFSEAAFALEVNELSDIVETEFGYHIILKTDYQEATEANFDTMKDAIKVKLINEEIYANNSTYTEDLRSKAKITNNLVEDKAAEVPATNDTPANDSAANEPAAE